ncbi:MAG: hypothetical protein KGL53_08105, partial [Elusimicrobia bacterium]|nr:hypothetical protein [Elusimicrobiota bacterium]
AGAFGGAGLLHARAMFYGVPLAGLVLLEAAEAAAELLPRPEAARSLGAWAAPGTALFFLAWLGWRDCLHPRFFDPAPFPVAAVDFVAAQGPAFAHRRVYNEWGWGGYLEWRLGPEQRVFFDGRYIFHPLLAEERRAEATPRDWRALLDRWGVEWALVVNRPHLVELPGGRWVEHYRLYFSDAEWALVHEDAAARVYVRRAAFPSDWVAARELRPRP